MIRFLRLGEGRGWRHWFSEISIVVIGVLIALGAQQWVENRNDRERADQAIAAVRSELMEIDSSSSEIEMATPCIMAQLDRVRARLVAGDSTLLPTFADNVFRNRFVVRAPGRPWSTDTWRSVSASDVLRRVDAKLYAGLSPLYTQIEAQQERNNRLNSGLDALNALAFIMPAAESQRFALVEQIEKMRGDLALLDLVAGQIRDAMASTGMLSTKAQLDKRLAASGTLKFCRAHKLPMGRVRPAIASEA